MPGSAKLILDDAHGHGMIKAWHLVAQLLQLDHGGRRQDVRSDGERLAQLDVSGAQRGHNIPELPGPCNLQDKAQ